MRRPSTFGRAVPVVDGTASPDARATGVNLGADMVRDQAHDALGVRGRDATAGVFKTA